MKFKYETREQWLTEAVVLMTPLFSGHGYKIPKVRVSCGWPSSGGLAKKRTIGQHWAPFAATDKVGQIFISPWLDGDPKDEQGVLSTLVHEVVHAVVGNEEKHNKVFGKCARAVGLEGKLTATTASKDLLVRFEEWMKDLGPYPHGRLDKLKSPIAKQTTRSVKCECPKCGFTVRTTRKWLDDVGAPHCPKHGAMKYTIPDELEREDEDED